MQPKILQSLPPVPMPRSKPQLPPGMPPPAPMSAQGQGTPGAPSPVPMAADPKEESLRQTILNAMMQKNPDLANMQEPGAMGAEGAAGMPPDQPPMDADAMMPPGPPGAPGASGLPPLPGPGPNPILSALPVSNEMLAGEDMGPPSPARQASMDAQLGGMDAKIAKNFANNKAIAKRLNASPQELQGVMPSAYTGGTPPPQPSSRQALIDMLLKGQGMQ